MKAVQKLVTSERLKFANFYEKMKISLPNEFSRSDSLQFQGESKIIFKDFSRNKVIIGMRQDRNSMYIYFFYLHRVQLGQNNYFVFVCFVVHKLVVNNKLFFNISHFSDIYFSIQKLFTLDTVPIFFFVIDSKIFAIYRNSSLPLQLLR